LATSNLLWIVALSRTTYFLALSSKTTSWSKEYQFSSAYDIGSFNAANLSTIAAAIRSGGGAQTTYEKDYAVSAPSPIRPSELVLLFYSCAQTDFTATSYSDCVCGAAPSVSHYHVRQQSASQK
jgi:hypothetical protein